MKYTGQKSIILVFEEGEHTTTLEIGAKIIQGISSKMMSIKTRLGYFEIGVWGSEISAMKTRTDPDGIESERTVIDKGTKSALLSHLGEMKKSVGFWQFYLKQQINKVIVALAIADR